MNVLIPYREEKTKTSLNDLLSFEERKTLSELMMKEIINTLTKKISSSDIFIVSPDFNKDSIDTNIYKSPVNLNDSLESAIRDLGLPSLIIPTDIPLLREKDVSEIITSKETVVISPGEKGGTNALLLREKIPLFYSGRSFIKHLDHLLKNRVNHKIYSNYHVYKDLDKISDIKDILNNLDKNKELYKWLKTKTRDN